MKQVSGITFALIVVLALTGAGFAYHALANQQGTLDMAPTEPAPSDRKFETIVGDETPFTPEW